MSLSGQVAWVTGAGSGIGRAIALRLAGCGARLLLTGRTERSLGEAVGEIAYQGGAARHLVADVRDPDAMSRAAARALELFGRLDIVVANAGKSGSTRITDDDPTAAVDILETNLVGAYHTLRAAARAMRSPGRLVAVGSVLGRLGAPDAAAYCASKAGLEGLVRALAVELGPRDITVNAVCPGWTDTALAAASLARTAARRGVSPADAERDALARVPLGRFIEPDEVARVVAFLCSGDAAAITGQAIPVCGGLAASGG